ncbi:hypothetical protein QQX98_002827 [Neonectria punicea]|uniref:Uncharacterized protein n=1 Tax=Neonectria punicea TaxID=979145 RepID=A0ABR1HHA9_9HYPO
MISGMKFLADLPVYDTEKPYVLIGFPDAPKEAQSNCIFDTAVDIELNDVRDWACGNSTLDEYGFEYLSHKSNVSLDSNAYLGESSSPDVVNDYLSETLGLVKQRFPLSQVIIFDWRIRRSNMRRDHVPTNNRAGSRAEV